MDCEHFQVSVIGIHSPKFEHERNKANIRHAIDEQSLSFNMVNDHTLQAWKHVGCQLWPTVLVFGPDALPLYIFEGENHVQHIESFLIPLLAYYKSSVRATATSSSGATSSPEDIVSVPKSKSWFSQHVQWRENDVSSDSTKAGQVYLSESYLCHIQWSIVSLVCRLESVDSM